jgi:hypothetical protein
MKSKYDDLRREELIGILQDRDSREASGLRLTYEGQTPPWQILRRIKPRRQRIERRLSYGSELDQSNNFIVEGENLQTMVSLYKYADRWTSFSPTLRTTQGTTSATTTSGMKTQTIAS